MKIFSARLWDISAGWWRNVTTPAPRSDPRPWEWRKACPDSFRPRLSPETLWRWSEERSGEQTGSRVNPRPRCGEAQMIWKTRRALSWGLEGRAGARGSSKTPTGGGYSQIKCHSNWYLNLTSNQQNSTPNVPKFRKSVFQSFKFKLENAVITKIVIN